ncbi:DUF2163 domain-containing protein [Rickettsiales endosymbiont of Trichoplax sp. H2]|uniref:DUF2163 domain-containing protein n=1 Tax=Rickettsiales endosymbiont of Trichoplax sp. H2 TaxID=2021221 RepID=UPI0012B31697|nr:DUF2163 domain-containing protein [Rickettsiales endosymbiont of Trichoplax sp. H2]MSO13261.1 hypothetical protein [Rickettsiales endosymbiont of Trichoplax sp. H2]
MIKIHNDLNNKQSDNIITYAICWYIKLNCGSELKFTNHNNNIKINDEIYISKNILNYKKIDINYNFVQKNNEISGIIDNIYFKKEDIIKGKFKNSYIKVFLIDINKVKYKELIINQGYIENIQIFDNIFKAKISPFINQFNKKITQPFSQNCRAKFCDKKCKLTAQDYTFYGKIERIISKNSFFDIKRTEKDFYFNYGIVTFFTGINKDLSFEVKNFKNNITELILPSGFKLYKNDRYSIITGCDKNFITCTNKFKNSLNFRGEPYIYNALKTNLK